MTARALLLVGILGGIGLVLLAVDALWPVRVVRYPDEGDEGVTFA